MTDAERNKAFRAARSAELKLRAALLVQTREDVIKLLNEALAEINSMLATFPTEYESYKLPMLQKQIEQTLEVFSNSSADVLAQGSAKAWAGGQSLVTAPIEAGGIRILSALPSMDTRMLMAMSNFMTSRMKDVGKTAAAKINAQLGLVLIGAQSPGDAVSAITSILAEEARDRAITITRTELGRVHAVAAQQRQEQAAKHVPGLSKQWRRSGKIHSRLNHDAIDGQIQPVDKPFVLTNKDGSALSMMHPHDPAAPAGEVINCGCVSIPYMKHWKVANPGRIPYSQLELQQKMAEAFDPNQQRDSNGRWAKIGSSTGARLPNFGKAVIDNRKLTGYALNPHHATGSHKARRFKSALGFDSTNAHILEQEIRSNLHKSKVVSTHSDKHGKHYCVDMKLTGPAGTAIVRTAWITDNADLIPRLTSVYVKRS
jgi:hypothetical protein